MARIESLSQLSSAGGYAYLSETYGKVIENVQQKTIASVLKNQDLSGTPIKGGSLEATRFTNTEAKTYGTARSGFAGQKNTVETVTVKINKDMELIHEVEQKDTMLYGVEGLIARKQAADAGSMERDLERDFYKEAALEGSKLSLVGATAIAQFEELVQSLSTTQNDYVDGVPDELIHVVMDAKSYGDLRVYIDSVQNANVNSGIAEMGTLHGIKVYKSIYMPKGVTRIAMCQGSVAQPVITSLDQADKFPASDAYHFGLFYYTGTKAVMADLIQYTADALANLTVTSATKVAATSTELTVTEISTASSYAYKIAGASAGTVPSFGEKVAGYTDATLVAGKVTIATTNDHYIIVVALNGDDKVIAGNQVKAVIASQ